MIKVVVPISEGGFEVWYGMRSGESGERARRYAGKVADEVYEPHDLNPNYQSSAQSPFL